MAFTIANLTFGYPGKPPVFDRACCTLPSGSFTAVTGPSGAGKSTFLRLLCRLEEPQSGTISFDDIPVTDLSPDQLRRRVVYIQQTPTVVSGTVRENLLLPFTFAANRELLRPDDATLRSSLDEFLLEDVTLDQLASGLSVGQKQRLCLIRGLLLQPKAMLFDEPTSALDPESADIVVRAALDLQRRGVTVVYVAHDRDLTSHECVDTLRLKHGKTHLMSNDCPSDEYISDGYTGDGPQPDVPQASSCDATGGADSTAGTPPITLNSRQRDTGKVRPGMMDGKVRPGVVDGKVRPGMVDGKVRPGTVDGKVRPGMVEGKVRPGVVDGKVRPGMVDGEED